MIPLISWRGTAPSATATTKTATSETATAKGIHHRFAVEQVLQILTSVRHDASQAVVGDRAGNRVQKSHPGADDIRVGRRGGL